MEGPACLAEWPLILGTFVPAVISSGGGLPPGLTEDGTQEGDRPGLVEGLVAVPALRRNHARWAPLATGTVHDGLGRGLQPAFGVDESSLGDARASGVAVIDEDGCGACVWMGRGRHAADVPAVTGCDERQESYRGMFGGVGGAGYLACRQCGATQESLGSSHHTAVVASSWAGRSRGSVSMICPVVTDRRTKPVTCLLTVTRP